MNKDEITLLPFTPSKDEYVRILNVILKFSEVKEDRQFAYAELEKIFANSDEGDEEE
jgi:hypothetical protein